MRVGAKRDAVTLADKAPAVKPVLHNISRTLWASPQGTLLVCNRLLLHKLHLAGQSSVDHGQQILCVLVQVLEKDSGHVKALYRRAQVGICSFADLLSQSTSSLPTTLYIGHASCTMPMLCPQRNCIGPLWACMEPADYVECGGNLRSAKIDRIETCRHTWRWRSMSSARRTSSARLPRTPTMWACACCTSSTSRRYGLHDACCCTGSPSMGMAPG